jgi:PPOX class probable F420-dependent enzyme
MLEQPAKQLLDRPGLLGVVCTTRSNGSPQANPVWFRRAGDDDGESDEIRIWTDEVRRWVKNLRRDPRVAFSVHENTPPWASVSIRARATLIDLTADESHHEIRAICARYLPRTEIDAYVEQWPQTNSIVALRPTAAFAAQAFEDPVANRRRPPTR